MSTYPLKTLFHLLLEQNLVIFLKFPESIFLLKSILASLENDLIIIGLMGKSPVSAQVYGRQSKGTFPSPPRQRDSYREMHSGAQRAGVSSKLSQLEVSLPNLNLKQEIMHRMKAWGSFVPVVGFRWGHTGYSFFTADFHSLVFQKVLSSCLLPRCP